MKIVVLFIALISSNLSFADAWDNLTLEEANTVVDELTENPYIFDYCDCCDFSGEYSTQVYLIKVVNTQIVTCQWNSVFYTVNIEGTVIAELNFNGTGLNTKKLIKKPETYSQTTFFMNYTWGFNPESKNASAFFDIIPYTTYGEAESCKKEFAYPTPKSVKKVSKDKDYDEWYKKVML